MKKYLFISLIFLHSLTTLSAQDESLELLYKKIERLELEIQDLRNLLEENSILVDRSLELQQQRYLDLDARLLELSKLIELETPSQVFNDIEVGSEEMGLYKDALSLFENSRFAEALEKFTEIIISFPDGSYASDSYFWSGELFLAQEMYEDAKINFESVIDQFPNSTRAPDSLFKLGEIYRVEGNTEKALIFYLRAKEEYPDSGAAQLAKKSEEILKEQSNLVD